MFGYELMQGHIVLKIRFRKDVFSRHLQDKKSQAQQHFRVYYEAMDSHIKNHYTVLIKKQNILKNEFPSDSFLISYDLILFVCEQNTLGLEVNVKNLFLSASHSYSAVRHHYLSLLESGYIRSEFKPNNKKTKLLFATDKSFALIEKILECIQSVVMFEPSNAHG